MLEISYSLTSYIIQYASIVWCMVYDLWSPPFTSCVTGQFIYPLCLTFPTCENGENNILPFLIVRIKELLGVLWSFNLVRHMNCLEITCLYNRGHKETFGDDGYVYWIVVVVTWEYAYFQTHQIVFINIVQLFFCFVSVFVLYINYTSMKPGEKRNNFSRNMPDT